MTRLKRFRRRLFTQHTGKEGTMGDQEVSSFYFSLSGLWQAWLLDGYSSQNYCILKKKQPIDFNHTLHNTLVGNGCESCHSFREDGSYSGVPKLAQCIECHEEVQSSNPEEIRFVEQYVKKGIEVPWLVYARQPDCVFFSHAAHVKSAKMDCATCHGPIGESESMKPYQQNRITGYSRDIWGENIGGFKKNTWDRMKMDDCSECHQKKKVVVGSVQTQKEGCFVCHK